jgi:hypothetical protein
VEQTQIEILVGELETAVDRLRSLYEQYFMGFEKTEPLVPRKDVDRKIHALRKEHLRNTALRFRFQMILQRYNTYQTHWQRILREIEAGTYKRHVLRAERRFEQLPRRRSTKPPPAPPSSAVHAPPAPFAPLPPFVGGRAPELAMPEPGASLSGELAAELAELDQDFAPPPPKPAGPLPPRPTPLAASRQAGSPAAPPQDPRHPPPPPAKAASSEGLPEDRVRQLYAQYVEAKRKQNESTAAITFDAVARSLRDSSSKLQQKHGKKVDFEVALKDGKVILRPVVK